MIIRSVVANSPAANAGICKVVTNLIAVNIMFGPNILWLYNFANLISVAII